MMRKRKGARGRWWRKKDVDVQANEEANEQKEAESLADSNAEIIFIHPGEDSRIVLEALSSDSIGHRSKGSSVETVLREQHWLGPQVLVSRDNSIYNYSTQSYEQDGSPVGMPPDEPVPAFVFKTPTTELLGSEEYLADEYADMQSNINLVHTAEDVGRPTSEDIAASAPVETEMISTSREDKSSKKRRKRSSMFRGPIGKWFFLKQRDSKCKGRDDQSNRSTGGFGLPPEVEIDSDHFHEETSIAHTTENVEAQPTSEDMPSENGKTDSVENHEPSFEKRASILVEAKQGEDPGLGSDEETLFEKDILQSSLKAPSVESPDLKVTKPRIRFWKRKDRNLKQVDEEDSVFTFATNSTAGWDKEISRHKEDLPEKKKTKKWKKKLGFLRKDKQALSSIAGTKQEQRDPEQDEDSPPRFVEMFCGLCYGCDGNTVACHDIALLDDDESQF